MLPDEADGAGEIPPRLRWEAIPAFPNSSILMPFPFFRFALIATVALGTALPSEVQAQDQRDEQFYYPGSFNWRFLKR